MSLRTGLPGLCALLAAADVQARVEEALASTPEPPTSLGHSTVASFAGDGVFDDLPPGGSMLAAAERAGISAEDAERLREAWAKSWPAAPACDGPSGFDRPRELSDDELAALAAGSTLAQAAARKAAIEEAAYVSAREALRAQFEAVDKGGADGSFFDYRALERRAAELALARLESEERLAAALSLVGGLAPTPRDDLLPFARFVLSRRPQAAKRRGRRARR